MNDDLTSPLEQAIPAVDVPAVSSHTGSAERRSSRAASHYAMVALEAAHSAHRARMQRAADLLIRWASSSVFLAVHLVWFLAWILWNTGALGLPVFDPFPYGLLTMVVSLEAIFLAIFVLIGQGRAAEIAELREELMLQVNLHMEAEVTKALQLVAGLYTRLGHTVGEDDELREMLTALDAEQLEKDLMEQIRSAHRGRQGS